MGSVVLLLWRFVLILVVLAGIARVVVNEIGNHYALLVDPNNPEIKKVLFWNPQNANVLYLQAKRVINTDSQYAMQLARRAYVAAPVNARALRLLADLSIKEGKVAYADQLVKQSVQLAGADARLLMDLAGYWEQRGQMAEVVPILSRALTAKSALGESILPMFLKIVESPSLRSNIIPLTQAPPPWWDSFYSYVTAKAIAVDTVKMLWGWRSQSKVNISMVERDATVLRFMQDNEWPLAYLLWANGLKANQIPHIRSIFNGGFELPISSKGFDWHIPIPVVTGVIASQDDTHGVQGTQALHLIFNGTEFRFAHVYQYLLLNTGKYRLSILAKINELQGRGGLVWEIACANAPDNPIAKTDKLIGTHEWRTLTLDFVISNNSCNCQILRLRSIGNTLYDHMLEGGAWFDNVQILKIRDL